MTQSNQPSNDPQPVAECDHEWKREREQYGADADGNRYIWVYFDRCRKCGEEEQIDE
jgi:hypothetical protein